MPRHGLESMRKEKAHPLGVPGGGLLATQDGVSIPRRKNGVTGLDRWLTKKLLTVIGEPRIAFVLWNGEAIANVEAPVARVEIRDRSALYSLLSEPNLGFGDAYSTGRVEVEGDLVESLAEVYNGQIRRRRERLEKDGFWLRWNRSRSGTRKRARKNIHHHYDLGNDFYRLWLDEHMVYTCAYYERRDATLEEAQIAKMDHVCRKLDLQSGQTVIEAGCGWGSFALHMAERYGATVKAFNISREQVVYAREQAKARGLAGRVEFVEDDYRNIRGRCDAFVSIGMLEHVGIEHYEELGAIVYRCLAPSGRGLIHSIGRSRPAPNNEWIEKRIFPGSYPASLAEMSNIFEPYEFSILDIENLRLHYRDTCQAWLDRFNAVADQVADMYDEHFVRAWRLYLAGSTAAFHVGTLQLFQIVFAPHGNNRVPRTRHHAYIHPRGCA